MKICPVCNTRSFADMATCYNCMHNFEDAKEIEESSEVAGGPQEMQESRELQEPREPQEAQEVSGSLFKLYPQAETFEPVGDLPIRVGIRPTQEEVRAGGNEARLEIVVSLQPALAEAQNSFFNGGLAGVDNASEAQRQVIELC